MPLIKSTSEIEKVIIRAKIPKLLESEIHTYMNWANVKKLDSFIQQAIEHILAMDREWREYKKALHKG